MPNFRYVSSPEELAQAIVEFNRQMEDLSKLAPAVAADAIQALSRARAWVAIEDGNGGYLVGFAKNVGHVGITLDDYSRYRKTRDHTRLDGGVAERHIKQLLGHQTYAVGMSVGVTGVGSKALRVSHPAVTAVQDFCLRFGKKPSALAEVTVFNNLSAVIATGGAPATDDRLIDAAVAVITALRLNEGALDTVLSRVKAAQA